MALNTDFKVKNSLYVSNSACFVTQTDTAKILSAGTSLFDIFLQEGEVSAQCALTSGTAINSINYNGTAIATISLSAACNTAWNQAYDWCGANSGTVLSAASWVATNGSNAIDTVAEGTAQGQIAVTTIGNTTSQVDVKALGRDDSPVFASLSSTGNILVGGTVDSRNISNDGTTLDTLQSLSGDNGLTLTSPSQGTLRVTEADGDITNIDLGVQTGDSPVFVGLSATCNILVSGTVDGRDIAADGTTSDTFRGLSGANINTGSCLNQGTVRLTSVNGTNTDVETGLRSCDSPTFDGVTAGNVTVGVSTDNTITTSSGNLTIDSAGGTTIINDATTLCGAVTLGTGTVAGTDNTVLVSDGGIVKTDEIDSRVWGSTLIGGSGTSGKIPAFTGSGDTLCDSIITQTGSNITIAGGTTITGNLSVTGDLTCIDTLLQTTSAVCIVNAGTGPALYAEQTGVSQPIAQFIDTEGGQVIIGDGGNVGIGTIGNVPGEKLTVSGNLSANGSLHIDGNVTLNGVTAGTDNTVIVLNDNGTVSTDEIDSKVWCEKLVDSASATTCSNTIPKFSNTAGTIGNSNITDNGTTITLNSNVTYGNGVTVKQPSAGGTVSTEDKVFVGTVGTSATGVPTFTKSGLNSVKYEVTLKKGVNITTFEVHAAYNGTTPCGTVYAIIDAQAASQLVEVEITSSGSTIDLDITAAAVGTTATIYGKAKY